MNLVYNCQISSTLNSLVPVEILEITSPKVSLNDLVHESIFHREEIQLWCIPVGEGKMES